ncbi:TerC family protein [Paenibacillus sp. HN-1]|uniref:TerC family protein n=1 Tax=Paenibacillus TaxID=44249 RepID=UPI001CA8AA0D|nr:MULTISPECIES: TerC family protein [Paenibacillus]MBY9078616.1 TerC family protein [Paenibacillus sp. CGMCC 1.18879]MBY9084152.1 TerC family protein [Paenibacillus sinensis]
MDVGLLLEYGWVLLVLVALEGLLAADNALVLAIMVKHLPEETRKKALFYGLFGAFIFRFGSLFVISYLVDIWQVQAIGALYLLFIAGNHIIRKIIAARRPEAQSITDEAANKDGKEASGGKKSSFWLTVLKVEIADIAFAVDSILAAVALAVALPPSGLPQIGGLDGGVFLVIFAGGFIGLVIMRFAASVFVKLLHSRPGLEVAAFVIVGWVGVKLAVITLAHPSLGVLSEHFAHSTAWKATFYIVLVLIAAIGWFMSKQVTVEHKDENPVQEADTQLGK